MTDQEPAITPEQIAAAEALLGLSFTPEQRGQMLEIVTGRREQYQGIRAADLDNSVPMALHLDVHAADPNPAPVPRSYPMSAGPPVARPADLEDAAFYPVTQLAELIRTRQITSLELTEMYLARLRRYDPQLLCVATYTDELAIRQAKRADDEIARGQYRGPLHGIPGAPKTCWLRAAIPPSGAPSPTRASSSMWTPPSSSASKPPAPC